MNYSAFRKYSQYRPEAVLLAEEIKSMGIEAALEQRFYREGTYYCPNDGKFTNENNPDLASCPACSTPCEKAFYQVDILLGENNLCIEIKGKAHDSSNQQVKDRIKEKYLKDHFGIETISARSEWFVNSKNECKYDWISLYAEGIVALLNNRQENRSNR